MCIATAELDQIAFLQQMLLDFLAVDKDSGGRGEVSNGGAGSGIEKFGVARGNAGVVNDDASGRLGAAELELCPFEWNVSNRILIDNELKAPAGSLVFDIGLEKDGADGRRGCAGIAEMKDERVVVTDAKANDPAGLQ